jgi:3D (Asp-Asp-Asp) domain-containing protein
MSIGAYARASLVVLATLVSNALASPESSFDPIFPDGTILPAALSFPESSLPQVDIPTAPKVDAVVKTTQPRPAQSNTTQSNAGQSKVAQSNTPPRATINSGAAKPSPAVRPQTVRRSVPARTTDSQRAIRTLTVRSTGYNSLTSQTDRTPHVTATGARTRFGIIAVSRDLLRTLPYGSRVRLEDMGSWSGGGRGKYNTMLSDMVFVVEDTMHPRKSGTVDVWFPARRQAIQWGVRRLRVTVLQLGR